MAIAPTKQKDPKSQGFVTNFSKFPYSGFGQEQLLGSIKGQEFKICIKTTIPKKPNKHRAMIPQNIVQKPSFFGNNLSLLDKFRMRLFFPDVYNG